MSVYYACKCTLCCPGCSNTTKLKMTNLKISKATPVVYASPPLSGGGVEPPNAKLATFRKMRSPVALEHLELLTTAKIPQADRLVIRRTDEQLRIRGAELDATDVIAAIFSKVRFLVNFSTPLPR